MCFELPKVWRNVDVDSVWITKSLAIKSVTTEEIQINRSLDYDRVLTCLQRIGHHIRNIHIRASQDFSSLYQFFVLLETYFDAQVLSDFTRIESIEKKKIYLEIHLILETNDFVLSSAQINF